MNDNLKDIMYKITAMETIARSAVASGKTEEAELLLAGLSKMIDMVKANRHKEFAVKLLSELEKSVARVGSLAIDKKNSRIATYCYAILFGRDAEEDIDS